MAKKLTEIEIADRIDAFDQAAAYLRSDCHHTDSEKKQSEILAGQLENQRDHFTRKHGDGDIADY